MAMASSMVSTAAVATRSNPAQATMVAPFTGLKSTSAFPVTKKSADITTLPTNGGRVQCMQVWPPLGKLKYETLSYLPDLTEPQLIKQVEYLLRNGWIPCIEFELENGLPHRHYHASPGYYDGRYWVMWKLPMFGCTDATQVVKEIKELEKEYPDCWARIIGFDKIRQVQCVSFTVKRPKEDKRPLPSSNETLLTNNFWSLTHPFATKFGDTPTFTDWKSGHY